MEESLLGYISKCRCCLEDVKGDTYLKMTKFTEERFFKFTSTSLTENDKLSTKICITCNSLLARYSALKKSFIENQNKLERLLSNVKNRTNEDDLITETDLDQTVAYTITEPVEHLEKELDVAQRIQIEEVNDQETILKIKSRIESSKPIKMRLKMKSLEKQTRVETRKIYRCESCSFEAKSKISFMNHLWKIHGGTKPASSYICEICSKGFFRRERLKRHLDHHNNIKRFFCDKCSFGTHAKTDLAKHLLTHLIGNDPRVCYKCDFEGCSAVYRWKISLKNHLQSHHLKEKLLACNLCSKSFTREISLRNHVRFVHYKERPVQCDFIDCGMSFSCKAHLNRHKKNIHSMK